MMRGFGKDVPKRQQMHHLSLPVVLAKEAQSSLRIDKLWRPVSLPASPATEALSVTGSRAVAETLDTGPPESRSFAELILQRSILAHAPPVLS